MYILLEFSSGLLCYRKYLQHKDVLLTKFVFKWLYGLS